jgi:hypothetical protein
MERERKSNERADRAEEVEVVSDGTMREGVAAISALIGGSKGV